MSLIAFWLSFTLLHYAYIIYPLILKYLVKPKKVEQYHYKNWPDVDVVISAYNEEKCIKERLENLVEQDYPGKFRVLVASDGSSDLTSTIIESFSDPKILSFIFYKNRGKVTILNELISYSNAEIVVLTDANTQFANDAITQLVSCFTPKIGAVSGHLQLFSKENNNSTDALYWQYEQFLKQREATFGFLLGANGGIYAIRRTLYQHLPANTLVDDYCIIMNIIKQNYSIAYNNFALAEEEVAPSLRDEFNRRVRIGIGNYRAFFSMAWALSTSRGIFCWCYISHKVLRWFAPQLLITVFLSNLMLIQNTFYLILLLIQITFYAVATYGIYKLSNNKKIIKPIRITAFFVAMNAALAVGFLRYITGSKNINWKSTHR
ncbi:MAG: glycosyltransferase family 2 protein [Paraglaciecola sp.]|uniref:glycosyltransferase family 2 protein n=1 Tax=Paraglaciecola sp. TaxID=1920173 RepID=UPI00273DBAE2|nr:glycosyltransferase family 2 protein [Paraglaciecola sp.]MDP5030753.1 glycosyltransferase family 2 protein [Paraglaciecola sp.]MDP5132297.1 glycosyltransferase family 2 protein [Paraglaciecola sp.]